MDYLELLEKKESLMNLYHKVGEATRLLAEQSNQKLYTLTIFTHVTDMNNYFNYTTSMLFDDSTNESAEHTLNALTSALDNANLLPLMKEMIKDYEENKLK